MTAVAEYKRQAQQRIIHGERAQSEVNPHRVFRAESGRDQIMADIIDSIVFADPGISVAQTARPASPSHSVRGFGAVDLRQAQRCRTAELFIYPARTCVEAVSQVQNEPQQPGEKRIWK